MVREYIGSRYVPKFMGTYDSTTEYEVLSVVDNGQGTSYITKIPTPAGTPLTDTTHWALYGASSGAIINLQDQIDIINNTDLPHINSEIQALTYYHNNKKAIILADSYGAYTNSDNKTMGKIAEEITSIPVEFLHVGGCGFVGDGTNTFSALIATSTSTPSEITDIIVCGGANDYSHLATIPQIVNAIKQFCDYCKSHFPNLTRIAIMANSIVFGTFPNYKGAYDRIFTAEAYQLGTMAAGADFIVNSQYIMHDTRLLINDFCHPNADGVDTLGQYIAQVLKGCDAINVSRTCTGVNILTPSAEMVSLGFSNDSNAVTRQYMQNGFGCFSGNGGALGILSFQTTGNITSAVQHTLGTINASLFSLYDNNNHGWQSIEGRIFTDQTHTFRNSIKTTLVFTIEDNVIKFIISYNTGLYECYGFTADNGILIMSTN